MQTNFNVTVSIVLYKISQSISFKVKFKFISTYDNVKIENKEYKLIKEIYQNNNIIKITSQIK